MIEHRISSLSSSQKIFESEIGTYEKALKNSGYDCKLEYKPITAKKKRIRTKRDKIMYFNPPFSKTIKTKVGKLFLKLIDDFFGNTIFKKYFNRSTIKISYSTMNNVKNHIAKHNAKISSKFKCDDGDKKKKNEKECDCTRKFKGKCPLQGRCLQKSLVYQAHVTTTNNNKTMTYTGMTKNTFKQRFLVHNGTIEKRPTKEKVTTLSDHVWKLKDQKTPFKITWSVKAKAYSFSSGSRCCDLCLTEKMTILLAPKMFSLNQRNELLAKCPHMRYFCLNEYCESSPIT